MASIVMSKRISPLSDRRGQQGLLPFALLSLIMLTPSFAAGDASLDSPASISTPVAVTAEIPPSPVAEPALSSLEDAETVSAPVAPLPSDVASVDKATDQPANHQPTTLEADETMSNPVATLPTDTTDQQAAKPATIEFVAEPVAAPPSAEAAVESAPESTVESSSETTVENSSAEQPVAATVENPAEHQPALLAAAEPTAAVMAEHAPAPVSLMPADAAPEAIAEAKGEAEPVAAVSDSAEASSFENAVAEEAPMSVDAPVAEQSEQMQADEQGAAKVSEQDQAEEPVEPVAQSAEDSSTASDSTATAVAEPEKVSAIEPIEQAIEHAPKDATAGNLFEVIFSFSLVIGLMLLFLWGVKRWQPKFVPGRSGLEIRAMLSLGGRDRLVVVQAGERQILLGVSPGRITLLGDYDELLAQPEDGKASAGETFKQLLKR